MKRYRKGLVALAGLVAQIIPALALTGTAAKVGTVALAAATYVGVHFVPNATDAGTSSA